MIIGQILEMKITQMAAGFVEHSSQRHRYGFQIGREARVIRCGQGREKMVLLWIMR